MDDSTLPSVAPPQHSPDGEWYWTGSEWVPSTSVVHQLLPQPEPQAAAGDPLPRQVSPARATNGADAFQGALMTAPDGWYPDNNASGIERYWDGAQWTEQARPAGAQHLSPLPS